MKLSEVIKAIEGGSKSEYLSGEYKIEFVEEVGMKITCRNSPVLYPNLDDWEEVKPPRQWSEKELMLFKLLPDWAKWISKYDAFDIFAYENEPNGKQTCGKLINLSSFDFLTITFEESPIYIGDLKGE